jgi:hypothetical protein
LWFSSWVQMQSYLFHWLFAKLVLESRTFPCTRFHNFSRALVSYLPSTIGWAINVTFYEILLVQAIVPGELPVMHLGKGPVGSFVHGLHLLLLVPSFKVIGVFIGFDSTLQTWRGTRSWYCLSLHSMSSMVVPMQEISLPCR